MNTYTPKIISEELLLSFTRKSDIRLGSSPHWDFKPNIEYIDEEKKKLTRKDKILLKCDCIDGLMLNRNEILLVFSPDLEKPHG